MKITKLFAATFAVCALFSCSEELAEIQTGQDLLPGEASVEINLGGSATTYATETQESEIKNKLYALYHDASGVKIPTTPADTETAGTIAFTVAAADVELYKGDVSLVVVANTTGFKNGANAAFTTLPNSIVEANELVLQGAVGNAAAAVEKGIPMSQTFKMVLKPGAINAPSSTVLKRAVSRIYVKEQGSETFPTTAGYKISYTGALTTNLVSQTPSKGIAQQAAIEYTILNAPATGSGLGQVFGYIYPSTKNQATFTIKKSDGSLPKTISFATAANFNYGINIRTTTQADGTADFTLTVTEYEKGTETDFTLPEAGSENTLDFFNNKGLYFDEKHPGFKSVVSTAENPSEVLVNLMPRSILTPLYIVNLPTGTTPELGTDGNLVKTGNMFQTSSFDWTGSVINIMKGGTKLGTIRLKVLAATEINLQEENFFACMSPFSDTKILGNDATVTVTSRDHLTIPIPLPAGHTFELIESVPGNADKLWIEAEGGNKMRMLNWGKYIERTAKFQIKNGETVVSTITGILPAEPFGKLSGAGAGAGYYSDKVTLDKATQTYKHNTLNFSGTEVVNFAAKTIVLDKDHVRTVLTKITGTTDWVTLNAANMTLSVNPSQATAGDSFKLTYYSINSNVIIGEVLLVKK